MLRFGIMNDCAESARLVSRLSGVIKSTHHVWSYEGSPGSLLGFAMVVDRGRSDHFRERALPKHVACQ